MSGVFIYLGNRSYCGCPVHCLAQGQSICPSEGEGEGGMVLGINHAQMCPKVKDMGRFSASSE